MLKIKTSSRTLEGRRALGLCIIKSLFISRNINTLRNRSLRLIKFSIQNYTNREKKLLLSLDHLLHTKVVDS
jgi:hypothetical protein